MVPDSLINRNTEIPYKLTTGFPYLLPRRHLHGGSVTDPLSVGIRRSPPTQAQVISFHSLALLSLQRKTQVLHSSRVRA
jgi:hypothetical protein